MCRVDSRRFAPRDTPAPETVDGLARLFEKFEIPSAFIAESLQNTSQSFAAQMDIDGTTYVWFHFLCKTVSIEGNRIVHQREAAQDSNDPEQACINAQEQSQANFDWLKPGFVLKVRQPQGLPRVPSRTKTFSSNETMVAASAESSIELFCFGAPSSIGDRFRKLKDVAICDDLVQDPYVLLEVVLEEMYQVLDQTGWAISRVFGDIEIVSPITNVCCSSKTSDSAPANPRAGNDAWKGQRVAARPFYRSP